MSLRATSLSDTWGRTHRYLRISLTEQCNFQCTYCMPPEGLPESPPASHHMTDREIITLTNVFVSMGVNKVRLTGGEPLLRKGAPQLALRLAENPALSVHMTTNGSLLKRHLPTLMHAVSGLNISIDSLDPERFATQTGRPMLNAVLDSIRSAHKHHIPLKLNAVVVPDYTLQDAIKLIEFAASVRAEVRFIEFMPLCGSQWSPAKTTRAEELEKELLETVGLKDCVQGQVAHTYENPNNQLQVGFIRSLSKPFCGTCDRVRLSCDGKLMTCLFSNRGVDLLTPLRDGANDTEIKELIRGAVAKKPRAHGQNDILDFSQSAVNRQVTGIIHHIGG